MNLELDDLIVVLCLGILGTVVAGAAYLMIVGIV